MEKMCWTDRVKNEEGLHRVKGERNILRAIRRRKAKLTGHCMNLKEILKKQYEER
jgi:hypothetical protein